MIAPPWLTVMVLVPKGVSVLLRAREIRLPWCTVMAPLIVLEPDSKARVPTPNLSKVPAPETGPCSITAFAPDEPVV